MVLWERIMLMWHKLLPNTLDVIKVKYGQKNGRVKTITYQEFLNLPAHELSPKEQELQKAMAKLYHVNDRYPPLFKGFPNWRPNQPLTIDATTLSYSKTVRASFIPAKNVVEFTTAAFDEELFSTLVHELKHAEDCTEDYVSSFLTTRCQDGLAYHQIGVLLEARARACELTAVMADCLDRKLSVEEFRAEIQKDGVYRYVSMIMPEVEKQYKNYMRFWAIDTGKNLQEMQHVATIAIIPHFVEGQDYKEGYFLNFNKNHSIKASDKGLQELPSSWKDFYSHHYNDAFIEMLRASFPNGKPLEAGADKITADIFEKLNVNVDLSPLLWKAIEKQDIAAVKDLIKKGVNINGLNNEGWSSLHVAANCGNVEIVNVLIKEGLNVDQVDQHGRTPLMLAAKNAHFSVVEALIKQGADVNQSDKFGEPPLVSLADGLHLALSFPNNSKKVTDYIKTAKILRKHGGKFNGSIPKVVYELFVKEGIIIPKEGVENGLTTSSYIPTRSTSVTGGQVAVSKKKTRNVNKGDKNWETLLIDAARNGDVDVVEALLKQGANVNQGNKKGETPLILAAAYGHVEVVDVLIKQGANVNQGNKKGDTPLHLAAINGRAEVVDTLIRQGANVNQGNKFGEPPLIRTAMMGHVKVAESLIRHGADVNQGNETGVTPLHGAVAHNRVELVDILIRHGADVNQGNKYGVTPLIVAAANECVESIDILIRHGANINQGNKDGQTPLIIAAENGHISIVEALIKHGVDVNQTDKFGVTPLSYVINVLNKKLKAGDSDVSNWLKIAEMLKQKGAEELQTGHLSSNAYPSENDLNVSTRLVECATCVNESPEEDLSMPKQGRGNIS